MARACELILPPGVGGREPFERSFDFSKLQNLQEVDFRVHWVNGSLFWIPIAFSTLNPATSPRLSIIRLEIAHAPSFYRTPEALIIWLGDDFRRVVDEAARIELEFKGVVKLSVIRGPGFKEALGTLNVRVHLCGWRFVIFSVLTHSLQILREYR